LKRQPAGAVRRSDGGDFRGIDAPASLKLLDQQRFLVFVQVDFRGIDAPASLKQQSGREWLLQLHEISGASMPRPH